MTAVKCHNSRTPIRKVALARRLRRETTVTLGWIAERLRMGSVSMVTHCLRAGRG